MPVKNTSLYLEECLDSIVNQSFPNWELLAVDDHSSDHSFSILKKYAEKDSRIKTIKNNGSGIIHALRTAYENSKGNLTARMDSDDRMSSDKLKSMHNVLIKNGTGHLALGLVEYFSENELGQGYKKYAKWLNNLTKQQNNFSEIYKECVIPSPCWMIWKSDLEKCGAFRSDIYPEDYDLCFRFYQNDLKIIPVLKTLHHWRDYNERTSRNDPNYLDNRFTDIKIKYFLEIDYKKEMELFLWGAGKKGKNIAKKLIENKINFRWICDNKNKIGKNIYGIILEDFNSLNNTNKSQIIISVSSPDGISEIKKWLVHNNIPDYYFFA